MCGITGFLDGERQLSPDELEQLVTCMADSIRHRGPDDSGVWVDADAGIALGFRRLSILDLSPSGHQPMRSGDGRYMIVFNGEIYNFRDLCRELENLGHSFRGHSDTEVMLAAFTQWGVEPALCRFNGMFAFALWDRQDQTLFLGRDRLGIKPLYYGWMGSTFLFGSELKALRVHRSFKPEIDRNALALFLRHNYIPAPYSIYQNVLKLMPGTLLAICPGEAGSHAKPKVYWSAKEIVEHGIADPFQGTEKEALIELDTLLRESIRLRMVADVPLGAFLSGGVDSSTVVALMQAQSSRPVKTFTIGFREKEYDESVYAKEVARHLKTEHTEMILTAEEVMAVIPKLPTLYDEPYADSSQIPTYLVSQLARQHVTVSLSGDGGDELFAGYNRYYFGKRVWNTMRWLPHWGREGIARGLNWLSPDNWQTLMKVVGPVLPLTVRQPLFVEKVQKMAEIIVLNSPEALYLSLVSHWKNPGLVVNGSVEPPTALTDRSSWANTPDFIQRMMYLDLVTYLPDDILVKVDRASMGVSLEARVPFLDDHRVVEYAWRLPLSFKIRSGQSKWLLRQVLYQYVPRQLIERPKMGFAIPVGSWLRGPLRNWAESLLDEKRLREEGFFNPQPIRQKWSEHLARKHDWHYYLWDILMFQAWVDAAKNLREDYSVC